MRLRIISGKFGGRFISADVGRATHPMGDRVRSGLFSSLESRGVLEDAEVLDAFAGTGAVGIEALSRGAKSVVFLERDKLAQKVIVDNITTLNISEQTKLIKASIDAWITSDKTAKFDLVFADPPYNNPHFSTVFRLLGALRKNGLMILSLSGREIIPEPNGVVVVDNRSYGEARLVIYRKIED
ncbi:MAG: 16S rRNA (guanine(966)-N(2))-methyltransferase RsmD [Candidatus Nomurabacteria bacterium]|jgi:16S rRNA (guanine966-N2)-methyltransferase|nr:16S rRNA (guanine(966)-N(2))-methyltransferase RsmD [Candidatus Nomurabacteria bacterium]